MGGGQKLVQPTPPAAPTAGQSAAEYAAALPQILQAQLQYQPQFDQQALDAFRELGPQYAQISRDVLNQYSPSLAALDETLAKQALDMSQNGLSQSAQDMFKNQFKSLVGDQASSGIGANFISKNLLQQNLAYQSEGRNLGLSLQGKVPISQPYQNPSSFQVGSSFAPAFSNNISGYGSVFSGAGRPQVLQRPDYLGAAGGFLQGVGSMAAFSSIELKKEVNKIENALSIISKINPVDYKWKKTDEKDGGVIAEQVEEVIPEMTTEINGIKAIKPMMLIGYIIKAIQELNEKIEVKNA